MATDITILMADQPGELARLGRILGERGVDIEGFCALTGVDVASEQEVAVVDVDSDRPGLLGEISRKLGDAEVNITFAYLATRTRLVFAADDLAKATALLS